MVVIWMGGAPLSPRPPGLAPLAKRCRRRRVKTKRAARPLFLCQKKRAYPGIEPGTTSTLRMYHTTRPAGQDEGARGTSSSPAPARLDRGVT